ncbi:MAG: BatA domain-containing protein [FCB group bacterium]|nr:BatA domain-containing protein [FCB group bacterium]
MLGVFISVPFIIHLIGERKYRPYAFSSLKFLREIERDSLQKLKLRQWLILLARALWIAMLVLALARPFFTAQTASPESGIILVDDTYSTGQNEIFRAAKKEMLGEFGYWKPVFFNEHTHIDTLRRTIREEISQQHIRSVNLILLSDYQDNNMTREVLKIMREIAVYIMHIPVLREHDNTAVHRVQILDNPEFSDGFLTLAVSVSQNNENKEPSVAQIYVNGRSAGRVSLSSEGYGTFRFSPGDTEFTRVVVRTPEDDYPDDNVRYLTTKTYRNIELLCIGDDLLSGYHLNAFEAMEHISLHFISPDAIPAVRLQDYDMVWLSGLYDIPRQQQEALLRYAENRPIVLTVGSDTSNANRWEPMIGEIRHMDLRPGFQTVSQMHGSAAFNEFNPNTFRILQYYTIGAKDLSPLWEMKNGAALLGQTEENIYVLLSPFLFDWNEMGLSALFTRALDRFVMTAVRNDRTQYYTGDPISLPRPQYTVVTPGGERHHVRGDFKDTHVPGFYVMESDDIYHELAVNIPSDEMIQTHIIPDSGIVFIWSESQMEDIQRAAKGRNAQSLFLILAALFLLTEMILLRKGEQTN